MPIAPAPGHRASRHNYHKHLEAGEAPCRGCRAANAAYHSLYRDTQHERAPIPAPVAEPPAPARNPRPSRSASEPLSRRADRAARYLPRVEPAERRRLIRHIAGDVATDIHDAAELYDALGLDPRDGKTEC